METRHLPEGWKVFYEYGDKVLKINGVKVANQDSDQKLTFASNNPTVQKEIVAQLAEALVKKAKEEKEAVDKRELAIHNAVFPPKSRDCL